MCVREREYMPVSRDAFRVQSRTANSLEPGVL